MYGNGLFLIDLSYFSFYELSSLINELRFDRRLKVPSI